MSTYVRMLKFYTALLSKLGNYFNGIAFKEDCRKLGINFVTASLVGGFVTYATQITLRTLVLMLGYLSWDAAHFYSAYRRGENQMNLNDYLVIFLITFGTLFMIFAAMVIFAPQQEETPKKAPTKKSKSRTKSIRQ